MGTRGAYGFSKNNVRKVAYNQLKSYPKGLGVKIVKFINSTSIKEMNDIFDRIIMVDEYPKPTKEEIEKCIDYAEVSITDGEIDSWYFLLRASQGNLNAYKEGLKYMIYLGDCNEEWNYIINLDTNCLDVFCDWSKKARTSIPLEDVTEGIMWDLHDKTYN